MGTIILKQDDSCGKTLFTIRDWLRCMQVQFMLKHKPQVLWFSQTLINANFSQLKQREGVHLKLRVFNIATNRDWASKGHMYWFERCVYDHQNLHVSCITTIVWFKSMQIVVFKRCQLIKSGAMARFNLCLDIRGPLHLGEVQSHLTLKNYHQQQHRRSRSWRLQAGFWKPILWCKPGKCNLCHCFDFAKKWNYNL
jgi:hypothetical protein